MLVPWLQDEEDDEDFPESVKTLTDSRVLNGRRSMQHVMHRHAETPSAETACPQRHFPGLHQD